MRGEAAKVAKNVLIIMAISDGLRRFSVRQGFITAQPVLDLVVSLSVPQSTPEQRHLKRIIVGLNAGKHEIGINRGAWPACRRFRDQLAGYE